MATLAPKMHAICRWIGEDAPPVQPNFKVFPWDVTLNNAEARFEKVMAQTTVFCVHHIPQSARIEEWKEVAWNWFYNGV